jgi:hypothetical protein
MTGIGINLTTATESSAHHHIGIPKPAFDRASRKRAANRLATSGANK